jgi:hypothetical protein
MPPYPLRQRSLGQARGSRRQGFGGRYGQQHIPYGCLVHADQYPGHIMLVTERTAHVADGFGIIQIQ